MRYITSLFACALFFLLSCGDPSQTGNGDDRAIGNARTYFKTNLGGDADKYEETNWGKVEARKVDFEQSRMYRNYNDALVILNTRLAEMDDSIRIEMAAKGESPLYNAMKMRRDAFQREIEIYENNGKDLELRYNVNPEYDGYWIYHEYKIDGQPKKAYILFRDTSNYDPIEVIYK